MRRLSAILAALFAGVASVVAAAAAGDPPVPPGRDPGGVAVALIGAGIDYTRDNIAQLLARDGEGEIIGYDFADDDRRPFSAGGNTETAEILIGECQVGQRWAASLIAIRADPANPAALAKAIGYVAQSPARIVVIAQPLINAQSLAIVQAASNRFPHLLLILVPTTPPLAELPNVLAVRSPMVSAFDGLAPMADVEVSTAGVTSSLPADGIAVARTAALAARHQASERNESSAALKRSILGLAQPLPADAKSNTRHGSISEPSRHFRSD